MTKKKSPEIFAAKMEIFPQFPKQRHSKILGPPKIFPPPQTRRQVSATDFKIHIHKK